MPARKKQWLILIAMSTVMVLINFELSAVNIALPSIANGLSLTVGELSWVISAYLITWALFLIPSGKVSDTLGKVKMFYIGAIIFAVASGIAGFAQHFLLLVICRVFQGLGAAIVLPVSTSIAYMAFSEKERGTPVGVMMLVAGLSLAAGPVFGGMITHYLGWRWVFYINIPITLFAVGLARTTVSAQAVERSPFKFDYLGFVLLSVVILSSVYVFKAFRDVGWFSTQILIGLVVLVLAAIALAIVEKRNTNPLLPVHLLRLQIFRGAICCRLLMNIAFLAILFSGPLYLQNVLHYPANKAGLIFLSMTLMFAIFSHITGRLAKTMNTVELASWGFVIAIVGFVALSFLTTNSNEITTIIYLAIVGSAIGSVFVSLTTMAMRKVSETDAAVANGLFFTFAVLGNMFGVTLAASIILKRSLHVLKMLLAQDQITLTTPQLQQAQRLLASAKPEHYLAPLSPQNIAQAFVSGFSLTMVFIAGLLVVGMVIVLISKNAANTRPENL